MSSLVSLTIFNFLDVAKLRLIKDPRLCTTEHFVEKSGISLNRNIFTNPKTFTKKCLDCLPSRNSINSLVYLVKKDGFNRVFFGGLFSVY